MSAPATLLLLHGRGHDPASMRDLAGRLELPDVACVAPAAEGGSWYPERFLEPRVANEPDLSRSLEVVHRALDDLEAQGTELERVILGGFSQGACLACEALATRPRRIGGLAALCGGLVGADEDELTHPPAGSLGGVPVLLTAVEEDAWVPVERVRRTAEVLQAAGADVELRVLPPSEHRIHDEEVDAVRRLVLSLEG